MKLITHFLLVPDVRSTQRFTYVIPLRLHDVNIYFFFNIYIVVGDSTYLHFEFSIRIKPQCLTGLTIFEYEMYSYIWKYF
jgi:hypothetical protein